MVDEQLTLGSTTGFSENAITSINHSRDQLFAPLGANVTDQQTIKNFLAKPRVITSSTWTSATLSNSLLNDFSIGVQLLLADTWVEKMRGYRYMRGTAIVRVELDVQPFIAGKLLLHFLPQYSARAADPAFVAKNQTLCSKTQQYSVEIDARDSVGTLRIPYISPFSHCDIVNYDSQFDWGSFFITVLSPCTSAAAVSVPYTIFLSFEDVELEAPTAQSGKRKMNNVLKVERKNLAQKGVISATLDNLVSPIQYFKNIPFVGEFVGTATDVLKGASGIFSAFGWSKAIDNRTAMPVIRKPTRFLGNFNGANESSYLALDSSCQVHQYDGLGGLAEDEMSFNYLKCIPAYIGSFQWATSAIADANLYSVLVGPNTLLQARTNVLGGSSYTVNYAPPFGFLSRYFKYYRGSINITLKFVKTQFHIGKVLVQYDNNGATTTNGLSTNALREVIDLKDASEITLNLPYLSNTSYLPYEYEMGRFTVKVLNPLLASSTVSSQIEVLVYASAGEDYEVGCINDCYRPAIVAQMNTVDKELVVKRIGGYSQTPLSLVPVQSSLGEAFVSVKQLLLSGRFVNRSTQISNLTNFPSANYTSLCFWPWIFGIPIGVSNATRLYSIPPISGDYLSEIAQGFGFYRGGIRYTFPSNFESSFSYTHTCANPDRLVSSNVAVTTSTGLPGIPMLRVPTTSALVPPVAGMKNTATNHMDEGAMDFTIPYQGPTPMRFTHISTGAAPTIPNTLDVNPDLIITGTVTGSATVFTERGIMRSAADDFTFIYFCGFSGFL